MKKLLILAMALVLVGAGCSNATTNDSGDIMDQKAEILKMAIADSTCDAWRSDASLTDPEHREIFRDMCYTEKAEATKNPKYCLSGSEDVIYDCIDLLALIANDTQICETYYPASADSLKANCFTDLAMVHENTAACDLIENIYFKEDCQAAATTCADGGEQCGVVAAGPFIGCDQIYDNAVMNKCEAEFKTLTKYIET